MKLSIRYLTILLLALWGIQSEATCTTQFKSNLRGMPSTGSSIIRSLPMFSPLKIVERQEDWIKVKGHKTEGWIYHTLIDEGLDCMTVKETSAPFCLSKHDQKTRPIVYSEGFKVLKKEIGCNLVMDKYGKKLWLSNTNIWPESESMKIIIN